MSETSSTHILYQLKCIHMEYDFSISAVNAPEVQEGLIYENTVNNSLNYFGQNYSNVKKSKLKWKNNSAATDLFANKQK